MKKLINQARRRLGVPGSPAIVMAPGESVAITDSRVAALQKNRMVSRWLEVGVLAIMDDDGNELKLKSESPAPKPKKAVPKEAVLPDGLTGEGAELHHLGGGWYQVYVNGFKVTDSNVRKDRAKELSAEYE